MVDHALTVRVRVRCWLNLILAEVAQQKNGRTRMGTFRGCNLNLRVIFFATAGDGVFSTLGDVEV